MVTEELNRALQAIKHREILSRTLGKLCDTGQIEEYHSNGFEPVVDKVIQRLPLAAER